MAKKTLDDASLDDVSGGVALNELAQKANMLEQKADLTAQKTDMLEMKANQLDQKIDVLAQKADMISKKLTVGIKDEKVSFFSKLFGFKNNI